MHSTLPRASTAAVVGANVRGVRVTVASGEGHVRRRGEGVTEARRPLPAAGTPPPVTNGQ